MPRDLLDDDPQCPTTERPASKKIRHWSYFRYSKTAVQVYVAYPNDEIAHVAFDMKNLDPNISEDKLEKDIFNTLTKKGYVVL